MPPSFPNGFLWGTATAAHQVEGNNVNNDWWAFEHDPARGVREPSGDACDQYHRFRDDIELVADLGLRVYRLSIEWSRIEPVEGEFSVAVLDHYRRVLDTCHQHAVLPCVTFHHFTTPRWATDDGGWEQPAIVDRFTRFCERTVAHLGDLIAIANTINEPNIVSLMGWLVGAFPPGRHDLGLYATVNEHLKAAHVRAYETLKAGPGDFPAGSAIAMGDWWIEPGPDSDETLTRTRDMHERQHLEAARAGDFVGVQAYSRTRLSAAGLPLGPEPGRRVVESMGYEFWPDALEVAVRYAAEVTGLPVIVTENGIGTHDDAERIEYTTGALRGLARCIADGVDVRGYFHWSLLDNFEWALGYEPTFGLVAVDRTTQARTPKPSARWLGDLARANAVP